MSDEPKIGDVFVEETFPIRLVVKGKFLKSELIITEYLPQTKLFAKKFGNQIECDLSKEQSKAISFALECLKGIDLYDTEYDRLLTSITRNFLKVMKGKENT